MDVIYSQNDNTLVLAALTNGLTSALLGAATVKCTLQDAGGTAVSGLGTGATWPLTMAAGSPTGTYRATLPHTLSLTTGTTYYAAVTASGGAGLYASWKLPVRATTRTG